MNKATTQKEKAGKKRKEKINQNVHDTSLDCWLGSLINPQELVLSYNSTKIKRGGGERERERAYNLKFYGLSILLHSAYFLIIGITQQLGSNCFNWDNIY